MRLARRTTRSSLTGAHVVGGAQEGNEPCRAALVFGVSRIQRPTWGTLRSHHSRDSNTRGGCVRVSASLASPAI